MVALSRCGLIVIHSPLSRRRRSQCKQPKSFGLEYPVGEESENARDDREHALDDKHGHQEATALRGGPVAGDKEAILKVEPDGAEIVDRPKHRDKHVEEEHAVAVVVGPENQDEGTEEGSEAETFQSKHVHNRDDDMGCPQ